MYEAHERIYLSVADRQVESFSDDENAFDRSLLLNVLFQPSVLLPDIFFFISGGIERHLSKTMGRTSLLEAALRRNIVVPAFRQKKCSSFKELLYILRGEGDPRRAIQGLRAPEESDRIAARLDAARDKTFEPHKWPKDSVAKKYEQLVTALLTKTEAPIVDLELGFSQSFFNQIWSRTERWRTDCVQQAIDEPCQDEYGGLRRGRLMTSVGRSLGMPDECIVNDVTELLAYAPSDHMTQLALRTFLRWMNDLYHFNQSRNLNSTVSFPSFHNLSAAVMSQLLPCSQGSDDAPVTATLSVTVPVPPLSVVQHMNATDLIKIREDYDGAYFGSLRQWQEQPSGKNADELRRTLLAYANDIVKQSTDERTAKSGFLEARFGAWSMPTRTVLAGLCGAAAAVTSIYEPWAAPLVVLGPAGYVLYNCYKCRPEDGVVALRSRPQLLPEVEFADYNRSSK